MQNITRKNASPKAIEQDYALNAVCYFEMICDELKRQPDMMHAYILACRALGTARENVDIIRSI